MYAVHRSCEVSHSLLAAHYGQFVERLVFSLLYAVCLVSVVLLAVAVVAMAMAKATTKCLLSIVLYIFQFLLFSRQNYKNYSYSANFSVKMLLLSAKSAI